MANESEMAEARSGPAVALPPDGRQSEAALAIQRGTCRLLAGLGFACLTELPLADGRRADVVGLSRTGDIFIVEIKSSLADFRADHKWPDYLAWCDRLYFAVAADFPRLVLPDEAGIITADRFGAAVLREAPDARLAGARRKALTLRLARLACYRLQAALDPDAHLAVGEASL